MATNERWRTAQQYERGFWESVAERVSKGDTRGVDFYNWRADTLVRRLRELGLDEFVGSDVHILELGAGPVGRLPFLEGRDRLSVDPLEGVYGSDPNLASLRDPGVTYMTGQGEELPAESGHFDMAIIGNCIDHVRDMDAVVAELHRTLRPEDSCTSR